MRQMRRMSFAIAVVAATGWVLRLAGAASISQTGSKIGTDCLLYYGTHASALQIRTSRAWPLDCGMTLEPVLAEDLGNAPTLLFNAQLSPERSA